MGAGLFISHRANNYLLLFKGEIDNICISNGYGLEKFVTKLWLRHLICEEHTLKTVF